MGCLLVKKKGDECWLTKMLNPPNRNWDFDLELVDWHRVDQRDFCADLSLEDMKNTREVWSKVRSAKHNKAIMRLACKDLRETFPQTRVLVELQKELQKLQTGMATEDSGSVGPPRVKSANSFASNLSSFQEEFEKRMMGNISNIDPHMVMVFKSLDELCEALAAPGAVERVVARLREAHHGMVLVDKVHYRSIIDSVEMTVMRTLPSKFYTKDRRRSFHLFLVDIYNLLTRDTIALNGPSQEKLEAMGDNKLAGIVQL